MPKPAFQKYPAPSEESHGELVFRSDMSMNLQDKKIIGATIDKLSNSGQKKNTWSFEYLPLKNHPPVLIVYWQFENSRYNVFEGYSVDEILRQIRGRSGSSLQLLLYNLVLECKQRFSDSEIENHMISRLFLWFLDGVQIDDRKRRNVFLKICEIIDELLRDDSANVNQGEILFKQFKQNFVKLFTLGEDQIVEFRPNPPSNSDLAN